MKKQYWAIAALAILALTAPQAASAQSCALCYTQAAGAGSRLIQGLRSGILVLIFPPMVISVFITALTWKRRNEFDAHVDKEETPSSLGW